ncbi:ANO5 [Bugula neritina]|uniref:Anoctamin n=1 Tax=Bugula neritina TaxID=10212 RepID=A0A7J7KCR5_BUGNE|nr:ANO5 [Bugula neritina]
MENYEDAEQVRPEFELSAASFRINEVTKKIEPYMTTILKLKKRLVSFSIVVLLLSIACGTAVGVITYRIAVTQFYASVHDQPFVNEYARLMAATTGSLINLIFISILDILYFYLALKLTAWENHRTESEHERSLTFKLFLFQCVNYYSAIIYIAMFKGKGIGRPGEYKRVFGLRPEECDVSGCFLEFAILCVTVMLGKQLFAIFYELALYPYILSPMWLRCSKTTFTFSAFKEWLLAKKRSKGKNKIGDQYVILKPEGKPTTRWEKDYALEPLPEYVLLYEYLELGVWLTIFKVISKLSIFVNAVILAWTSDVINKLLYLIGHCNNMDGLDSHRLLETCSSILEKEGSGGKTMDSIKQSSLTLQGYVKYTLSKFDVRDWESESTPLNNGTSLFGQPVEYCFYKDFRYGPEAADKYGRSKEFWHNLAAKLGRVQVYSFCFYSMF